MLIVFPTAKIKHVSPNARSPSKCSARGWDETDAKVLELGAIQIKSFMKFLGIFNEKRVPVPGSFRYLSPCIWGTVGRHFLTKCFRASLISFDSGAAK